MSYLPETIAVPFKEVADRLKYNPLLFEYSYCYALGNWRLINDPEPDNINYSNDQFLVPPEKSVLDVIKPIRSFVGCQDEHGFMAVHLAIVALSHT